MEKKYERVADRFSIVDQELGINLDGEIEFEEKDFFPNGTLRYLCCRTGDKLHGPSLFYSASGALLSETWFFEGNKVGRAHRFYPTGELYSLEHFVQGVPHLAHSYYYLDGQIKTLINYAHGLLDGETKLYWPDGKLKRFCTFAQGEKVGEEHFYDEEGRAIEAATSVS